MIPFATVMMSGVTPSWSTANQAPVLPNPLITSSQISRISYFWHSSFKTGQPPVGRHDQTVRSGDRLDHDRGNGVGPSSRMISSI